MKKIILRIVVLTVWLIVLGVTTHALAAQSNKRFVDNLDGTITDSTTGLMWEKKTGSISNFIICSSPTTCADPSNVNNIYSWSSTVPAADGTLFSDFLAKMNCTILTLINGACGAGPYSDWRVPTVAELRTISTAEPPNCLVAPCIDPIFGPTQASLGASFYCSYTTYANNSFNAWGVNFNVGNAVNVNKLSSHFARAVRGGR